ncbi:MAG: hypothetical protein ACKO5K_01500 [Armatimonadota bacterium]
MAGVRLATLRLENRTSKPRAWVVTAAHSAALRVEPVPTAAQRVEIRPGIRVVRGTVGPRAATTVRFAVVPGDRAPGKRNWSEVFRDAETWGRSWEFTSLPAWLVPAAAATPAFATVDAGDVDRVALAFRDFGSGAFPGLGHADPRTAVEWLANRLAAAPDPVTPAGWIRRHAAWSVLHACAAEVDLRPVANRAAEARDRVRERALAAWPSGAMFPLRGGSRTLHVEDVAALDVHRQVGMESPFDPARCAAAFDAAWSRCFLPEGLTGSPDASGLRPDRAVVAATDVAGPGGRFLAADPSDAWRLAAGLTAGGRMQAGATIARCLTVQGELSPPGTWSFVDAWIGMALDRSAGELRFRPVDRSGFLRSPVRFPGGFGVATVRSDDTGVRATLAVGSGRLRLRKVCLPRPSGFAASGVLATLGRDRLDARWSVAGDAVNVEWERPEECVPGRMLYVSLL